MTNPRVKNSKKEEWDTRENSIVINLPPLSVCIFQCTPVNETPKKETKTRAVAQPGVKKSAGALNRLSKRVEKLVKKTAK